MTLYFGIIAKIIREYLSSLLRRGCVKTKCTENTEEPDRTFLGAQVINNLYGPPSTKNRSLLTAVCVKGKNLARL